MRQSQPLAIVFALFALLAAASFVAAQPPEGAPQRPRGARGALAPAEVVAMLDAYAVVQAQDALQLNDAQYGTFVTRLKKLQDIRRKNQQTRNQLLQELRRLTAPAAATYDENAIRAGLKSLRDLDDRSAADVRHAYDAIDEVLDVPQQARFRIFEETIERRKLDLLMRARQGAAGRGGS